MKINLGKLAKALAQIAVAAPTVIAAVKPVVDTVRKPRRGNRATENATSATLKGTL